MQKANAITRTLFNGQENKLNLGRKQLMLVSCLIWLNSQSQNDPMSYNNVIEIGTFNTEVIPQFVGGREALANYLNSKAIEFNDVINREVSGTVLISFYINLDGTTEGPEVTRSVYPELDQLSLRLITRMPKWLPGMRRNRPIKSKVVLSIVYVKGKIQSFARPVPSKYWTGWGSRKLGRMCKIELDLEEVVCQCWCNFIVWNYNDRRLRYLDLKMLFERQSCGL